MKTFWIKTLLFILSSSPVFAYEVSFYGGISGGAVYNTAELSTDSVVDVYSLSQDLHISHGETKLTGDDHALAAGGQFQLGTGLSIDKLYLGLEFLGQFTNGNLDTVREDILFKGMPNSVIESNQNLELRHFEPSIDFKPGYFLSENTLLYARVGAAFNEATLEQENAYSFINGLASANTQDSHSENVVGLRLGLGVEYNLTDELSMLFDYTYTNYGDISLNTSDSVLYDIQEGTLLEFDIQDFNEAEDLTKHAVMIGFNYYI